MTTHTYAIMDISTAAYNEIAGKLRDAGYDHAFQQSEGRECIDMHGVGLRAEIPADRTEIGGVQEEYDAAPERAVDVMAKIRRALTFAATPGTTKRECEREALDAQMALAMLEDSTQVTLSVVGDAPKEKE